LTRARIGVLVSGRGTNLQALLDACAEGRVDGDIVMVTGNKAGCGAMEIARQAGVPRVEAFRLPDHGGDLATRDRAMADALRQEGVQLVVTAGYDRVLDDAFVQAFRGAILNLHPSLLPSFAGGMDAIAQAHRAGVPETGVTVHFVEPGEVDAGGIVAQEVVAIRPGESLEDLEARVHAAEHALLPRVVQAWIEGRVRPGEPLQPVINS
jgi:phosphoribosylglycinamide formyltransferase-1